MKVDIDLDSPVGGYWAVLPDSESNQILLRIASCVTDICDLHDLHVTLGYDDTNPVVSAQPTPDVEFSACITRAELFGDNSDILVLLLDSQDLVTEHQRIHACGAAKFDFNPYNPHVTIKYGASVEDMNFINEHILTPNAPAIQLVFTNEYSELIDNDAK